MNFKDMLIFGLCVFALAAVFILTGCCNKTVTEANPEAGPAEKAGAAMDRAAEATSEEARRLAEKTNAELREASEKAVEKSGEVIEKIGDGLSKAGTDLQETQKKKTKP